MDGRSAPGLVYVSVEIGPDNRTPQLVDAEKEKITEEKIIYEPVEYTTLDYLATSEAVTVDKSGENILILSYF
ncbi:hypothetical protein Btru_054213 [Bulinus truncatus]|nr:hypothetical protein Btru_054213 [Bulinus truncatus]